MMKQKILRVILLFASINLNLMAANETECKRKTPDGIWEKYILRYLQRYHYCKHLLGPERNYVQCYYCETAITPYFNINHENTFYVIQFAKVCKNLMRKNSSQCTKIMLYLNSDKLCWTMETAPKLLNILSRVNFLTDENLNQIDLNYTKYTEFEKAKINLANCSDDLRAFYENTIDVLNYFLALKNDHIDEGKVYESVCNCEQISGIYKIFSKRKMDQGNRKLRRSPRLDIDGKEKESKSDLSNTNNTKLPPENPNDVVFKDFGDDDKKELSDLYKKICLENSKIYIKDYWTKSRLDVLAEQKEFIITNKLSDFMIDGFKIAKAGWYDLDKPKSQWPVKFLFSKLLKNREVNSHAVELVAKAIKLGFSSEDYQEFVNHVTKVDSFNKIRCVTDILDAVMYKAKTNSDKNKKPYWRSKKDKHNFNEHLKILIDFYTVSKKTIYEYNCDEFSDKLISIESVFYSTNWSEQHMNSLIKSAMSCRMTIDVLSKCLEFSYKVEKNTETFILNNSGPSDWAPNNNEQANFRIKLFSDGNRAQKICYNVDSMYNVDSKEGLMKVYNAILKKVTAL